MISIHYMIIIFTVILVVTGITSVFWQKLVLGIIMGVSCLGIITSLFLWIFIDAKPPVEPQKSHELTEISVNTQDGKKTIVATADGNKEEFHVNPKGSPYIQKNTDQYKNCLLVRKDQVKKEIGIFYKYSQGETALYIDEETYNNIFDIQSTTYQLNGE